MLLASTGYVLLLLLVYICAEFLQQVQCTEGSSLPHIQCGFRMLQGDPLPIPFPISTQP